MQFKFDNLEVSVNDVKVAISGLVSVESNFHDPLEQLIDKASTAISVTNLLNLKEGDRVYLSGIRRNGICVIENEYDEDSGKVFLRLIEDDNTGDTDVRLSVSQEDIDAKRLFKVF